MKIKQKPQLHQAWIDRDALEIVEILQKKKFTCYLVGGCVRDLLVGLHPKDYDIATDAKPQEVKRWIRQAYIIGKRFRLVLVKREDRQFEVATFRRNFDPDEFPEGAPEGDNIFGTPEEDAQRRDFTINSFFYDPVQQQLIDYNDGMSDIENRVLRMIGDPEERLVEDPIRILRALRLAHKLGFSLDSDIRASMQKTAHTLPSTVLPRRREEILKLLRLDDPSLVFQEAFDLGILKHLSATLNEVYENPESVAIFNQYLQRLPALVHDPNNPVELFAPLILGYLRATFLPEPGEALPATKILDNDKLARLFRDELGMFKYEQSLVAKALQLSHQLFKTEDFRRKGERRRMALLRNESFPLALTIAESDYLISCTDLQFWHQAYDQALPEIRQHLAEESEKRREQKRRRWTRKGPKKAVQKHRE